MNITALVRRFHVRHLIRGITAVLLAAVFNLLVRWGDISYSTLAFARSIPIVMWLVLTLICYEVLTILTKSLPNRTFDAAALAVVCELTLFLVLLTDDSPDIALGSLGIVLLSGYLIWPWLARKVKDPFSRPYIAVICALAVPLVLLICFRLFDTAGRSLLISQKDLGINLITQIMLSLFWGSAIGTLLYTWQGKRLFRPRTAARLACTAFVAAAVFHAVLVACILLYRYWSLRTTTYDFGLFAQMFSYMRATGQPLTTLERNVLLSHFAVHLSPIFYLMLPFYLIWPDPATLQILQPIVVASGLLPLLLIARHLKLKPGWQAIAAFIYAFHPGLIGSSLYDLHENCFLAPLLLWVLYFLEKKRWTGFLISSVLVLMIKEDAPLYLIAIALYAGFSKKNWRFAAVLGFSSAAYFAFALWLLARIGTGPMIGRLDNLMAEPAMGLFNVPLTILRNPAYLLSQIFTEEKLVYMIRMFLPVGFLPLLNRRAGSWTLLLPMLVMNLMIDYPYQFNLRFQYHYGTGVLLIFMLLLQVGGQTGSEAAPRPGDNIARNANRWPGRRLSAFAISTGLVASLLFGGYLIYSSRHFRLSYIREKPQLTLIKSALDTIPMDASVQASNFLTTYLSGRLILYDFEYNQRSAKPHVTEYLAFDMRGLNGVYFYERIEEFAAKGYEIIQSAEGAIVIMYRPMP